MVEDKLHIAKRDYQTEAKFLTDIYMLLDSEKIKYEVVTNKGDKILIFGIGYVNLTSLFSVSISESEGRRLLNLNQGEMFHLILEIDKLDKQED